MERSLSVKLKDGMSNSTDPDETAHYEPSHLDLCCLQKPVIISSERVKVKQNCSRHHSDGFFFVVFVFGFSEKISHDIACEMSAW